MKKPNIEVVICFFRGELIDDANYIKEYGYTDISFVVDDEESIELLETYKKEENVVIPFYHEMDRVPYIFHCYGGQLKGNTICYKCHRVVSGSRKIGEPAADSLITIKESKRR